MQNQTPLPVRVGNQLMPVLVALATLMAFLPTLQNGFVNWDDDKNLLENPYYRGLGWHQLRWMFTTFHMSLYRPLTWMTLGLDYLLWGMNPFGYHLTSLILHAVNALLFYYTTLRLLSLAFSHIPSEIALKVAAGFGAVMFAIHPLRVEAVAWASARSELLSGLFFLGAILCYLRYSTASETNPTRLWWLMACLIIYGLSLLSKAVGITLPILLLVFDVYPLRRLRGAPTKWFVSPRVWWEKLPFVLLAVGVGSVALLAKEQMGAMRSFGQYDVVPRLAQSLFGIPFYLWKTVLPLKLSPLYELPAQFNPRNWSYLLSGALVLVVSMSLFLLRRRWPAGLALWISYIVILAPVAGIAQSGPQITADRYSYLSCLGWAILAGAGLLHCWQLWVRRYIRRLTVLLASGLTVLIMVGLGALTWEQVQVWHDSESLWGQVLYVGPSKIAHNNLANVLVGRGQLDRAIDHYREALRIDPDYVPAYNNLGLALAARGELETAIEYYRQALRIYPAYAEAHANLATALLNRGELETAIDHYRKALQLNPADANAHNNLGLALASQGEFQGAVRHFRRALELSPTGSQAHLIYFNLGTALSKDGRLEEAIDHFRQALRIWPDFAEAHESLGRALARQGKGEEATKHYNEARILRSGVKGSGNER